MVDRLKIRRPRKEPEVFAREEVKQIDDIDTILQSAIMYSEVCKALVDLVDRNVFETHNTGKGYSTIFEKIIDYYRKYEEAPNRAINIIFARDIKEQDNIIPEIIQGAARQIEAKKKGYKISPKYVIEEILPRYVQTAKLNGILTNLDALLFDENHSEAMEVLQNFEVPTTAISESFDILNPSTIEYYQKYMERKKEMGDNIAFEFKKDLGDIRYLVGPLMKGWTVSIAGTTKSGKSSLALDIALDAAYRQNKKVMFISVEMQEQDLIFERYIPWLTEIPYSNFSGRKIEYIPKIDCLRNQTQTCNRLDENKKPMSPNSKPLYRKNEKGLYNRIPFEHELVRKWKTCHICRPPKKDKAPFYTRSKFFNPVPFWFKQKIPRETFVDLPEKKQIKLIEENLDTYTKKSQDNLIIKIIPKFSKTITECLNSIDEYEKQNNWKPDIVIIDYLDILKLEGNPNEPRHQRIDNMWKKGSGHAQQKNFLLISPEQTTGRARSKRTLDHTVTAEAIAKDNHVDKKIGIVKHLDETKNNLCRVNMIYDRHAPFDRQTEVLVFQDLTYGFGITDSVYWHNEQMPPYSIILGEK